MKKLSPQQELEEQISFLKFKKNNDLLILKNQYMITIERLKMINIIKTATYDFITAPNLKSKVLFGVIGLGKYYLTKNILDKYASNTVVRFLRKTFTFLS